MAMKSELDKVTSTDGTPIAIARAGHGPAVVIVGAGPTDRSANAVAAGRPGDAVELFFTLGVGWPAEWVAPIRDMPSWPALTEFFTA